MKSPIRTTINFPQPPEMMTLGTEPELAFVYKFGTIENIKEMKASAATRRDTMEVEGKSDHWAARQQNIMLKVNSDL